MTRTLNLSASGKKYALTVYVGCNAYIVRCVAHSGEPRCLSLRVYISVWADRRAHTLTEYTTLVVQAISSYYLKMKLLKMIVFAFFALLVVAVRSNPLPFETVHELEDPCVRQGGLCVMKSDCPPENIVFLSGTLCPKQQHLGVTCCYLWAEHGSWLLPGTYLYLIVKDLIFN